MKKLFFSFLVLAGCSSSLFAQVQVGIRAGVHGSTVRGQKATINPGFAIAVPVQLSLTNHWAIRAEPSFIQKGWRDRVAYTTDLGQPAGTGAGVIRYDVAELPLLISFRNQVSNHFAYYGLVGPSIGYALGGQLKIRNGNSVVFSDQLHFDNRTETGIWAGGGIEVPLGGVTSFLDVRYQYGLSQNLFAARGKMYGFTVSLGCWLPTKK